MENKMRIHRRRKTWGEALFIFVFLAPWLADILVFKVYPFFYGIYISFCDVSYKSMRFVGLQNYVNTFDRPLFWEALIATVKISMITIPLIVLGSLFISFILHRKKKKFKKVSKIVLYLPAITSEVVLAIIWRNMFSGSYGISASISNLLGMAPIPWLTNEYFTVPLVGFLVATLCIAQPVILVSNAIDNMNPALLEAAQLDGASSWQQLWYITLPTIRPTISFVLITTTIANLQVFYVPFLLTGGGPENKTVTLLYLIYKNAFEYGKYGIASAQGMVLFVIIGALVLLQYKLTKAGKFE